MSPLLHSDLLDAGLLEEVAHLRLVARRVPSGGRFADQPSRDRGAGIEFEDHRPYAPGDDLRSVDWALERRLGRVFVRLFEQQEDLPLYLLVDTSRSGYLEDPPRVVPGMRAALALAAVALNQHDPVGVFPFAEDLTVLSRPVSGRGRIHALAERLAEVEPGGDTDFARSLHRFGALGLRSGLTVIVSDFFDPRGIEAVTGALSKVRQRLLLVQLTRPSDRDPGREGDLRLEDCESGLVEDVSVTGHVLERYREAYDRWQTGLTDFARKRGAGWLKLDVERPVVPQLATVFEGGRFQA